jgi:hypothetical protein
MALVNLEQAKILKEAEKKKQAPQPQTVIEADDMADLLLNVGSDTSGPSGQGSYSPTSSAAKEVETNKVIELQMQLE